jgi:hypothetical protein
MSEFYAAFSQSNNYLSILAKSSLATFWATFLQTHLVSLWVSMLSVENKQLCEENEQTKWMKKIRRLSAATLMI